MTAPSTDAFGTRCTLLVDPLDNDGRLTRAVSNFLTSRHTTEQTHDTDERCEGFSGDKWKEDLIALTRHPSVADTDCDGGILELVHWKLREMTHKERGMVCAGITEAFCSTIRANWGRKAQCAWVERSLGACQEANAQEYADNFVREWYRRIERDDPSRTSQGYIRKAIIDEDALAFDELLNNHCGGKDTTEFGRANRVQNQIPSLRSADAATLWTARKAILGDLKYLRRISWHHVGRKEVLHLEELLTTCLKTIDPVEEDSHRARRATTKSRLGDRRPELNRRNEAIDGSPKSSEEDLQYVKYNLVPGLSAKGSQEQEKHDSSLTYLETQTEGPFVPPQWNRLAGPMAVSDQASGERLLGDDDEAFSAMLHSQNQPEEYHGVTSMPDDASVHGWLPGLDGQPFGTWGAQFGVPIATNQEATQEGGAPWDTAHFSHHFNDHSQPLSGVACQPDWADLGTGDVSMEVALALSPFPRYSDWPAASRLSPSHPNELEFEFANQAIGYEQLRMDAIGNMEAHMIQDARMNPDSDPYPQSFGQHWTHLDFA